MQSTNSQARNVCQLADPATGRVLRCSVHTSYGTTSRHVRCKGFLSLTQEPFDDRTQSAVFSIPGAGTRSTRHPHPQKSTPNGIRTRVTALKGQRPGPLDDGGLYGTVWVAGRRRYQRTVDVLLTAERRAGCTTRSGWRFDRVVSQRQEEPHRPDDEGGGPDDV